MRKERLQQIKERLNNLEQNNVITAQIGRINRQIETADQIISAENGSGQGQIGYLLRNNSGMFLDLVGEINTAEDTYEQQAPSLLPEGFRLERSGGAGTEDDPYVIDIPVPADARGRVLSQTDLTRVGTEGGGIHFRFRFVGKRGHASVRLGVLLEASENLMNECDSTVNTTDLRNSFELVLDEASQSDNSDDIMGYLDIPSVPYNAEGLGTMDNPYVVEFDEDGRSIEVSVPLGQGGPSVYFNLMIGEAVPNNLTNVLMRFMEHNSEMWSADGRRDRRALVHSRDHIRQVLIDQLYT